MNRAIITFVTVVAGVIPVLFFVSRGHFVLAGMAVAVIFLLILFRRMDLWWALAVATAGSSLQIMTHQANVSFLAILGFCGLGIMAFIMTQGRSLGKVSTGPKRAVLILLPIVILTASMRGWGLRILGSSNWGGMDYIILLSALMFYLFSFQVKLTRKRMWRVVLALCILSLIPAISLVLIRMASTFQWLQLVVRVSAGELGGDMALTETRWGGMQMPAVWTGLLALMLYDRKMRFTPLVLFLVALSFTMMGLSGHRTVTVWLGLTLLVYIIYQRRAISSGQTIALTLSLATALILIYVFASHLPLTFQRALAWLPGIEVSYRAAMSAVGTTTWRIEMWHKMLPMIPQYLFIGRGLGFDLGEAYAAYTLASDIDFHEFFIATHNYHNGPLFLLIDLGLAGFLASSAFMIGGSIYYKKRLNEIAPNSEWRSMYVVFLSFFVASCIFFFVVIGFVASFAQLLVVASILQVILQSAKREQEVASKTITAEPVLAPDRGLAGRAWAAPQPRPIGGLATSPAWNRLRS